MVIVRVMMAWQISVYYTAGIGLKYKLSNKFDIELRPTINLNEEDHLDAAISVKQNLEMYYQTNLGIVFKLNHKDCDNYVWQRTVVEDLVRDAVAAEVALIKESLLEEKQKENTKTESEKIEIKSEKEAIEEKEDVIYKDVSEEKEVIETPRVNDSISTNKYIYFDTNSSILSQEAKNKLNDVLLYFKEFPQAIFLLEYEIFSTQGNISNKDKVIYNQNLSKKRTESIKNYLVSNGASAKNLKVSTYGKSKPKLSNQPEKYG